MSAEDAFGANLTPAPSDIELVSVFLRRDPAALEAHDQGAPIGPGRFHYLVFLFFRDSRGNLSRIRCWCELSVTNRLAELHALDALAIKDTRDLIRNGIIKNAKRLETLWDKEQGRLAKMLDEDKSFNNPTRETVSANEICFDHGYCSDLCEHQKADRIYTCLALTGVFWRGRNELWATASAVQDFPSNTQADDRDLAVRERSKQLFCVAAELNTEEMKACISAQPSGSTEVFFGPSQDEPLG
ncbi:MAG: hypothetical protein V2I43_27325 [Parvularcula sp.]|nr:hypothetical protein [Parvularcula sp.]